MGGTRIFIRAAQQISIQQPLSEQWMVDPIFYREALVKAIDPDFSEYLSSGNVRRMGIFLKRALVTSLKVMDLTGCIHPEAIITGTSIGSLNSTELFLGQLIDNEEESLSPIHFMQSTHNTLSSTLGIFTKNHSYNTTYSHGGVSFDLALLDAWMQMKLGKITTSLVGGYDEMVDSYFELLKKSGYVGIDGMVPCSEISVSMLLDSSSCSDNMCELAGVRLCSYPTGKHLERIACEMLKNADMDFDDISAIMTGINGNPQNDGHYRIFTDNCFQNIPLLHYKHVFGENYTSSALGVYAAANCLEKDIVPAFLSDEARPFSGSSLRGVLLINQVKGREYSLILLKKI